jgi:hypothetical protein
MFELLTTKALGADGESYGASGERSLLNLLQTLASMWSFFEGRFFEGDIGSLWYELRAENVDRKTLNAHLFLCFGWVEIVMA